jgi:thiosulfate/3-mercaptopyruvate sulfurtransferase
MTSRSDILITVPELANLLASDPDARTPVRLLDVRWRLDRPDGRPAYRAGHIPGAAYVDLDTQLARHGAPTEGRHPLPAVEQLERDAREWGLDDGDAVIVYDDLGNMSAARAWWLLRHAGVTDVRMLDGGLGAWRASGHALDSGEERPRQGSVTLAYGHLPVLDIEAVAAFPRSGTLLDARAEARYRGEVEPIDPRAGHIPGALNTPTTASLDDSGRFLADDDLRKRFLAAGVDGNRPVATYCGSGVTAAHNAAALMLAGFEPALYPGSWSAWSNHPDRPVATGPTP